MYTCVTLTFDIVRRYRFPRIIQYETARISATLIDLSNLDSAIPTNMMSLLPTQVGIQRTVGRFKPNLVRSDILLYKYISSFNFEIHLSIGIHV